MAGGEDGEGTRRRRIWRTDDWSLPVVAGSSSRQLVEVQGAAVVVREGRVWRRWEEMGWEKGGGGEEGRLREKSGGGFY